MKDIERELHEHGIDGDVVEVTSEYVIVDQSEPESSQFKVVAYFRANYQVIAKMISSKFESALEQVKKMICENIAFIRNRFTPAPVAAPSTKSHIPYGLDSSGRVLHRQTYGLGR